MRADERRGRAYGEFTLSELVGGYLSPRPNPSFLAHNRREVRCRLPSGGEDMRAEKASVAATARCRHGRCWQTINRIRQV